MASLKYIINNKLNHNVILPIYTKSLYYIVVIAILRIVGIQNIIQLGTEKDIHIKITISV